VTRDAIWIGNWVYCTRIQLATTNNYDNLTKLHAPTISVTIAHKVFSVFTSRYLLTASNGGRSPLCEFPNYPRTHLPASHFSQMQLSTDSITTQGQSQSQSQSYFTTFGLPPIRSSWRQTPWGSRPHFFSPNWSLAVIVLMQHHLWREIGYVSSEETSRVSSVRIAHIACYWNSSISPGFAKQILSILLILWTTSPCYRAPARTAQEKSLPLFRVLSLPGKQRVHRAVP
jgi:hypothetical protein